jgi:hypothetical protein
MAVSAIDPMNLIWVIPAKGRLWKDKQNATLRRVAFCFLGYVR